MKGFTLIEMAIIIVIVSILASVAAKAWNGHGTSNQSNMVTGRIITDSTQTDSNVTCVSGFKFINGKQILNQNGGGLPCQ